MGVTEGAMKHDAAMVERRRWLKAVVRETRRPDPRERWCNDLTGDYHSSFHQTREEAEAAALRYVEQENKT